MAAWTAATTTATTARTERLSKDQPPEFDPPPRDPTAPGDGLVAKLQAELSAERAARERAERVNVARDEFLGLVSHELRTPLNAMVGWLHVLESGRSFGEQAMARATTGLSRAVNQQRDLVDLLLDTARAMRGELRLEREPIQLGALVRQAIDRLHARGVSLQVDFAEGDEQGAIDADPGRIARVLDELLAHATRFADHGPLMLRLEEKAHSEPQVTLHAGFAAPSETAWAAFRTTSDPTVPQGRRRGLSVGLVLGRLVCELHGGSLDVDDSEAGARGVELRLPARAATGAASPDPGSTAARAPVVADAASAEGGGSRSVAGLRILIVDDQREMRDVLASVLGQGGAHVEAAGSAGEAMPLHDSLRGRQALDIAVLDIAMPGEDGIALVTRMREAERTHGWPRLPVIALTAHATTAMREQALAAGFDRFLAKPLSPVELCAAIARLIPPDPTNA